MVRDVLLDDADQICKIYNYYIQNTIVSFEESPVAPEEMASRIQEVIPLLPWIVYEENKQIVGYAFASKWKGRCAYRYSVETTVYLSPESTGKGIGSTLYEALISLLRQQGFHTAIGGISLPNEASIKLHEKFGFKKVAHFSQVGFKFNKWVDVAYWELLFS
jgi:L-amino acid N-acyltransferase YncA